MDSTWLVLGHNDDFENITVSEFEKDDQQVIDNFIELTRHLKEIKEVFDVFQYNLLRLRNTYCLKIDDRIHRNIPSDGQFTEYTEINALLISFISAGRTLVETMLVCAQVAFGTNKQHPSNFEQYVSDIYDTCFSYKLLYHLRNFSQHGHIPVSFHADVMCFDLGHILRTPHIKVSSSTDESLNHFFEELVVKRQLQPYWNFTMTVAEYTVAISKVYAEFWHAIIDNLRVKESRLHRLIKTYPECIVHENERWNGFIFFMKDDYLHTFCPSDPTELFDTYATEATGFRCREEGLLTEFCDGVKFVPIDNTIS